jgi:hypothetical protein
VAQAYGEIDSRKAPTLKASPSPLNSISVSPEHPRVSIAPPHDDGESRG